MGIKSLEAGDEEDAFIKFMKYIGLITHVQKLSQFKSNKDFYSRLIGRANIALALENAEKLRDSLERRYAMKSIADESYHRDKYKADYYDKINDRMDDNDRMDVDNSNKNSITVQKLYEWIMDKNVGLLIIDCRPSNDYEDSHLLYPYCCNVPENIIRHG